jgi:hypothetical protein
MALVASRQANVVLTVPSGTINEQGSTISQPVSFALNPPPNGGQSITSVPGWIWDNWLAQNPQHVWITRKTIYPV